MSQCTATAHGSGERCRAPAIRGATVCQAHGGSAPQVRAAAQRRLAEQEAARTLSEVGVAPIDNPLQALADLVAETVALKDHLAAKVAALGDELRANNNKWGTEQMRAEYQALERAYDRCGRLLEAWVRLGIDERRLAIQEMSIDLMDLVMRRAWARLGHDQNDDDVQRALEAAYRDITEEGAA